MAIKNWGKKDFMEFRSEFNMTSLDFSRMDEILKRADDFSLMCGCGNYNKLIDYYWSLKAFWRYIRPLLNKSSKTVFDDKFEEIFDLIYKKIELRMSTFRQLEELHNELLEQRQLSGVGLLASKHQEIKELKPEFR